MEKFFICQKKQYGRRRNPIGDFFFKIVINHRQYISYNVLIFFFIHLISLGGVCMQRIGTSKTGAGPGRGLQPYGRKFYQIKHI